MGNIVTKDVMRVNLVWCKNISCEIIQKCRKCLKESDLLSELKMLWFSNILKERAILNGSHFMAITWKCICNRWVTCL